VPVLFVKKFPELREVEDQGVDQHDVLRELAQIE
jgi:hypothetical protein